MRQKKQKKTKGGSGGGSSDHGGSSDAELEAGTEVDARFGGGAKWCRVEGHTLMKMHMRQTFQRKSSRGS